MTDSLTEQLTPDLRARAEAYVQWRILRLDGKKTHVNPGQGHLLKNYTNRHFLQYKNQGAFGGINLGFSDNAEPSTAAKVVHWEFLNRQRTPVKYDEPIAIRCKSGYLRYGSRDIGINLHWSDGPVYEWRLLGGKPGTPVMTSDWFSIFNTACKEPMIRFVRTRGGDIGWPSSETWFQQVKGHAKDAVEKAIREYVKSKTGG